MTRMDHERRRAAGAATLLHIMLLLIILLLLLSPPPFSFSPPPPFRRPHPFLLLSFILVLVSIYSKSLTEKYTSHRGHG